VTNTQDIALASPLSNVKGLLVPDILQWIGFGLCHQLPERSFFGGGIQVPVCARDTGIYAGFLLGFLLFLVFHWGKRPAGLPPLKVMPLLALFVLVMVVDGGTSYMMLRESTNELRLITGLTTGFALAAFVFPLINGQLWRTSTPGRVLDRPVEIAGFVVAVPVAYFALWTLAPLAGVVYPWLIAGAIIFTFASVNLVLVTLIPIFERKVARVSQAIPAILAALGFAVLQLFLASSARIWLTRIAESLS